MGRELFVFQGGGPTAVINATLSAILDGASGTYDRVSGLSHSLENPSQEALIDLTGLTGPGQQPARVLLAKTPGAILGSSRQRVSDREVQGLLQLMRHRRATDIIGIGGNGTMQVLNMLAEQGRDAHYPLRVVGAPKTVDNDLPGVHCAPGFGSAARFVAMAVRDFDCDFRALQTFDDVTILETMGRDTGWLAAASVLLREEDRDAPHMVLLPERAVNESTFLDTVAQLHQAHGRVFIVTNEVLRDASGDMLGAEFQDGPTDGLGRVMYSLSVGTAHYLARLIRQQLKLQVRCLRPGNLARAFSTSVSEPDFALAIRVGHDAVKLLRSVDETAQMLTIDQNLLIACQPAIAGVGRKVLPQNYLNESEDFAISEPFRCDFSRVIGPVEPIFRMGR